MKTASVRQIQHHFREVLSWINEGEEVEITKNRRVVARLMPAQPAKRKRSGRPDFAARLKRIYGDMAPLPYNPVLREREESPW
jgi:antitoxin (DNA-binding transcriptional repressor) of toxin-antitoxin stability system